MTCKLPPKFQKVMDDIRDCQKHNPTDSAGMAEPCVDMMMKAMNKVADSYLGRGNFRHAWAFRDGGEKCIVKVANNDVKRAHNRIEADTWRTAPEKLKKHLAPVTDSDPRGLWLVMPEAGRRLPEPTLWKMGQEVEQVFSDAGYYIPDQHSGNVGVLDGNLVSIDYGFGLQKYTAGRGHVYRTPEQSKHLETFDRETSMRAPQYTYIGGDDDLLGTKPLSRKDADLILQELGVTEEELILEGFDPHMVVKGIKEDRKQKKLDQEWSGEGGWKWRKE